MYLFRFHFLAEPTSELSLKFSLSKLQTQIKELLQLDRLKKRKCNALFDLGIAPPP